jgi:hypothetical protein
MYKARNLAQPMHNILLWTLFHLLLTASAAKLQDLGVGAFGEMLVRASHEDKEKPG